MVRKKSTVAGIDLGNLLTIAVVGVGGYLVWKYVINGSGGNGTSQNNSDIDKNTLDAAANDLAKSKAKGIQQELPDTELNGYADSIFQLIGNAGGDPVIDSGTAAAVDNIVTQVNNDTDWFRLVQLFGTKKYNSGGSMSSCALLGLGCDSYDLPGLLHLTMPAANLSNINSYFSDQGMSVNL